MSVVGRSLDLRHEVSYLRDALDKWLNSPFNGRLDGKLDHIRAKQAAKLALLKSLDRTHDENYVIRHGRLTKEFHHEYPVFTATLDYGATGEGRLLLLVARRAYSEADFLVYLCGEISGYYSQGATLYRGLPPEGDHIYRTLASESVKSFLEHEVKQDRWGGHVDVLLQQYVNYS